MSINIPGFAYHKALKARKNLVEIFQSVVNNRRKRRAEFGAPTKKGMMDNLMDINDYNGRKLEDDEIIDTLVMYLNAGHESSGHVSMWAAVLLQQHPNVFQKDKVHFWHLDAPSLVRLHSTLELNLIRLISRK